jgi:integrase/recombinase XerD
MVLSGSFSLVRGIIMVGVAAVRFSGPLTPFAAGFAAELGRLGYTPLSARTHLALAAHLGRWLDVQGVGVDALSVGMVEEYLQVRRAAGYHAIRSAKGMAPLLGYLRGLGVAPPEAAVTVLSQAEVLLAGFRTYLLSERGLVVKAARGYVDLVRPFVADAVDRLGAEGLAGLAPGDVTGFLVAASRKLAAKTTQRLASAMRSLLGFWHVTGVIPLPLAGAVPRVACRQPRLPRALAPAQVQALFVSCDTSRRDGLRDLAMLTLMARVGLRCGEVAGLLLDDIDWHQGLITVRGKGNRHDLLPLPADVGEAIAAWLTAGRPPGALDRAVFTRVKAPHRGLTPCGVTMAVQAAAVRAGMDGPVHAHRLRHSAATAMLAAGSPLAEIGQVLRHRRALTTAGYARVDVEALRGLARPWPGAA